MPVKIVDSSQITVHRIVRILFFIFFLSTVDCQPSTAYEYPRYEITASLDIAKHRISARQKVTYVNNSGQELNELFFHVYPHRTYTPEDVRFLYRYAGYFKINPFPEGFQSGDLRMNAVSSSGTELVFSEDGKDRTLLRVQLHAPLPPGESVEIDMDYVVDIPHSFGRFGWHKNIISLTRWYPILSVFDEQGWHTYPFYIYHQPFFSEAAYYKVSLTVPAGQTVVSSGTLRQKDINADGTRTFFMETGSPVRDFGMGISDGLSVFTLEEGGVHINAYYLSGDEPAARDAARHARDLMRFYAARFGAYPYPQLNLLPGYLGYGGCQSSGLVFIDTRAYALPGFLNRYFDFLISHETGHQWFYNIIGSDEYKEMFLDEGMNSFWLHQYLESKYGPRAEVLALPGSLRWLIPNFTFRDSAIARYIYMAKNGLDGAVVGDLSSFQEPSSIFALAYGKGAAVLGMLRAQAGADVFERIVRRYAGEFRFKNISLAEFIKICNEESGRDFTSFFQQWLKTDKNVDFAVASVRPGRVVLENRGSVAMPVSTRIVYADGGSTEESWDGMSEVKIIGTDKNRKVKQVEVDPDEAVVLDLDRTNNHWPRKFDLKPVPFYFFPYEIPLFSPRDSYNLIAGPRASGSAAGAGASLSSPYNAIARLSSEYDFNGKALDSRLGCEIGHLFNTLTAAGFELFDYESSKDGHDLRGGKLYLRKELWPASYGLFDLNDHVTGYIIRNQEFKDAGLQGQESIHSLHYRRKDEAIAGITGSLGRYGPYPDPQYGWKFMPTQEFAGHFLGGSEAFWRTSVELDRYHLLFPRRQHVVAARIKCGWGESSDKDLFQIGGPDGLRGYGRKTVAGAHMFLGGVEYRLPVRGDLRWRAPGRFFSLDKIQAVGFFDAGRAWYASYRAADFKKDAGLGVRVHLNLLGFLERAVVRLDVAQAINEPKEDPHIWFGLSQVF